ncbi:hypothetical protein FJTKL_11678 [Diaporthe vaccinii]|uniref:Uncharacterized protein n=1 Tax=Diaporthe vaccinii TaxID=105482 RepID=A0ABR4EFQ1_9PEZI
MPSTCMQKALSAKGIPATQGNPLEGTTGGHDIEDQLRGIEEFAAKRGISIHIRLNDIATRKRIPEKKVARPRNKKLSIRCPPSKAILRKLLAGDIVLISIIPCIKHPPSHVILHLVNCLLYSFPHPRFFDEIYRSFLEFRPDKLFHVFCRWMVCERFVKSRVVKCPRVLLKLFQPLVEIGLYCRRWRCRGCPRHGAHPALASQLTALDRFNLSQCSSEPRIHRCGGCGRRMQILDHLSRIGEDAVSTKTLRLVVRSFTIPRLCGWKDVAICLRSIADDRVTERLTRRDNPTALATIECVQIQVRSAGGKPEKTLRGCCHIGKGHEKMFSQVFAGR